MGEQEGLRVSDADRERAALEIREHFAAGRLSEDELHERLAAVYAARTEGELAALRADLPPLPVTQTELRGDLVARRAELRRQLVQRTGGSLTPFVICTAVWLASGANGSFWPGWVLLVVLLPLLRNGWRLYGPAPDLDRVERELAGRRAARRARRRR